MEDFEQMEMPTPCEHCGEIFDLEDGFGSEKWHPNIVICEECYRKEEAEIEEDDRLYELNIEVSNSLFEVKWEELTEENQTMIKDLVNIKKMEKQNIELKECIKQVFPLLDKSEIQADKISELIENMDDISEHSGKTY